MKRQTIITLLISAIVVSVYGSLQEKESRSFVIDYDNDRFLKDGEPFRYVSGSIHPFRVLHTEWKDRLQKLRWAGFNVLQTYVEWSSHEPEPGVYNFTGRHDIEAFIKLAQEQDLLVILRVGPFMCGERDMGGLPYWLLRLSPNIRLRTSDPDFLNPVDQWLRDVLLPKIKPLLYANGGPIIMVQVENEYGSSSICDFTYTNHLRDLIRDALGDNVVLFTTDSAFTRNLGCGKIPEVYATVDFGIDADPDKAFGVQRLFEPKGPLVNSEFYPGWIDHWGEPHHTTETKALTAALDKILSRNASVNMYMFHGGTNFGLSAGSNLGRKFQACLTSYDYDAPVSEAGDPTEKYTALKEIIQKYIPVPQGPAPSPSPKGDYGTVYLEPIGSLGDIITTMESYKAHYPLTFEELHMSSGIVVYKTTFNFRIPDPARLNLGEVHDRAYVFLDDHFVGIASREEELYEVAISTRPGSVEHSISIVVESQGRISVGPHLNDFKGLTTNVTLNGQILKNWQMTPLPLINTEALTNAIERLNNLISFDLESAAGKLSKPHGGMTFYRGFFSISGNPKDTFLSPKGWRKGIAWVNDFNLGRYWPEVGPQVTLYVPRGILREGNNAILLLELEISPCQTVVNCTVDFQTNHDISGPTPE